MQELHFDGYTYDPAQDQTRLTTLLGRVKEFMADGQWRTLAEIQKACGGTEASCSARLRDLRKERFGAHIVQHHRQEGGLWFYRIGA